VKDGLDQEYPIDWRLHHYHILANILGVVTILKSLVAMVKIGERKCIPGSRSQLRNSQ
jgi:hypothetical protein